MLIFRSNFVEYLFIEILLYVVYYMMLPSILRKMLLMVYIQTIKHLGNKIWIDSCFKKYCHGR